MPTKLLCCFGLIALAAPGLHSQPTNGPVYWSTTVPDCSSLGETAVAVSNSSGAVVGYSCYVSGTFIWFAAGGGWTSAIRAAAPASAPIGIDYTFYDNNGNNLSLDTTSSGSSSPTPNHQVTFALTANQPSAVTLMGATGNGPGYGPTSTGSVYAVFYCPDALTCSNVLPQLVYLQQPTNPWLATVPIAWDNAVWTQWSAEGIDDGVTNVVSFVAYNEGASAASFKVNVYDSTGRLVGTGSTPSLAPVPLLGNGTYGEGGTYGATLRTVIAGALPSGPLKILVDCGNEYCAVMMLQFTGPSMSSMQVAYDSAPTPAVGGAQSRKARAVRPQQVFGALQQ